MIYQFFKSYFPYFVIAGFSFFFWNCSSSNDTTPAFDFAKQALKDDTILRNYLYVAKKDTAAIRTSSGLFYSIKVSKPDSARADTGRFAYVRYEGFLLDSTSFDSNLLTSKPLIFQVGLPASTRRVITGLDEGISKFRKGEKGFIYLPSGLAYKNIAQSKIPANSCLKFYVELANVENN